MRFISLLEEGNVKSFWKYIKSKKQDASGIAPLKSECRLYSEASAKAILKKLFKSVFSIYTPSPLPNTPGITYPNIKDLIVTNTGTSKHLKNININTAAGPDGIPNNLLKELHQ